MHIGQTVTRILMRTAVILFYIERIFVSFFAGMGAMSIKTATAENGYPA